MPRLAVLSRPVAGLFASVRFRAAVGAALTAGLLLGIGALWLRHTLYTERMNAAIEKADSDVRGIAATYFRDGPDQTFPSSLITWVMVLDTGDTLASNGELDRFVATGGLSLTPDVDNDRGHTGTAVIRLGRLPGADRSILENRVVTFVGIRTDPVPREKLAALLGGRDPGSRRVTVYVLASPREAELVRDTVDGILLPGIPVAVLLVAGIAWIATGRALRPVEAIRGQLADITAQALDRRVPVPPSRDEVHRLAVTTNATLDRLEHAVRRQRRFVADAAHELRSPLAVQRSRLEVSLAHPDTADWPAVVDLALADARRLQSLVQDLLLLARLDGALTAPMRPVDLAAIVEEQVAERAYANGRELRWSARTGGPTPVAGDAAQLGRLLRNLLDNAARHARSAVTVSVTTDPPAGTPPTVWAGPSRVDGPSSVDDGSGRGDGSGGGGQSAVDGRSGRGDGSDGGGASGSVWLEVLDDGPGIPLDDRERVFERFARLDDARARDTGGTGLGLAIVREIATHHGGTVAVEESPVGARLVVRLPG